MYIVLTKIVSNALESSFMKGLPMFMYNCVVLIWLLTLPGQLKTKISSKDANETVDNIINLKRM